MIKSGDASSNKNPNLPYQATTIPSSSDLFQQHVESFQQLQKINMIQPVALTSRSEEQHFVRVTPRPWVKFVWAHNFTALLPELSSPTSEIWQCNHRVIDFDDRLDTHQHANFFHHRTPLARRTMLPHSILLVP